MAESVPWLLVGLGNPGGRYADNRHNVGFMVARSFCDLFSPPPSWTERFKGLTAAVREGALRCVALCPQTYMNRSGAAVRCLVELFAVAPVDLLVIYDEVQLPLGRLRLRAAGSPGGHRGMESVVEALQTQELPRLRLGIMRR